MKMQKSMNAFTLVELLVVVAIIGILATMMLPALAKARESARRASCKSNLHQMQLGMEMYSEANSELYPPDLPALQTFMGGATVLKVFCCPSSGATNAINYTQGTVKAWPLLASYPGDTVMIQEPDTFHKDEGHNCVTMGGSVMWVKKP